MYELFPASTAGQGMAYNVGGDRSKTVWIRFRSRTT